MLFSAKVLEILLQFKFGFVGDQLKVFTVFTIKLSTLILSTLKNKLGLG